MFSNLSLPDKLIIILNLLDDIIFSEKEMGEDQCNIKDREQTVNQMDVL